MKNTLLIILSSILISGMALQAQNQNPFDSKKKVNTGKSFTPSAQLQSLPVTNSKSSITSTVTYKSIPFLPMNMEDRHSFRNPEFNNKGQLILLEGNLKSGMHFNPNQKESVEMAALEYLNSIGEMIGIKNPSEEFKLMAFHTDAAGQSHIKLQQFYNNIKVYGGQVFVHGKNQLMDKFNGEYFPTPEITDLIPSISVEESFEITKNHIEVPFIDSSPIENSLVNFEELVSELVLYHPDFNSHETHLAWHLTVRPNLLRRFEYFIDAHTGEILNWYNHTCSDGPTTAQATDLNGVTQTINTYELSGNYFLIDASREAMWDPVQSDLPDNPVGAIWTINANNTSVGNNMNLTHYSSSGNSWNNVPEGVSAHYNAGETYEYFKNTHNRNSINGQGGTIISICNITNEDGSSMENAFWNGQAMFYGNGGNIFSPLAGALDVGGHEMAHGVVQNTCNLEYQGESGALNESMADIAGCMVDRDDWYLAEDVVINTNYFPTGRMRDMSNPHNGGTPGSPSYQPAHTSEQYFGPDDNGGVHINSGIMNFAYYKFATEMGKDKAEQIYYKSMTDYLVKSSQFVDARVAFVQASTDLYGASSMETNAVKDAFTAVGIGDSGGGNPPGQNDLQTNPGADFILSYDVNINDPNTLYISNTDGTGFIPISTTQLQQKPSIVDNGSFAVFVTPQKQIKGIELNNPYDEYLLDSNASDYDNISVSKDGSRIAIVTTSIDSAIWVYDFNIQQWAKFHLYNPTFTPGVITENVLYADALEWDYTGQYIIYDAYNKMQNSSGEDIDYWDMSILRVWDAGLNSWADGKIEKVFSNLPEGVSMGNPSLSKNSPYILAFDYLDNNTGEINVMAANLETGDVGTIFQNVILGSPNFSKNDDKIIFNAQNTSGVEVIGMIGLQSNKILPAGSASILIDVAKWGVWYATGDRNLIGIAEQTVYNAFSIYPNPSENYINVLFTEKNQENSIITIHNTFGQIVLQKTHNRNELLLQIEISDLPKGNYFVRETNSKQSYTKKFIKL